MKLYPGEPWVLRNGDEPQAEVDPAQIRYSVSWKAYCFDDAADQDRRRLHDDDLTLEQVLTTMEHDLRGRGVLTDPRPEPKDFAVMIVDTYTRFPVA